MIELYDGGVYLLNGTELAADNGEAAAAIEAKTGKKVDKKEAAKETIAYGILADHNTSGNMEKLKIKFDKLTSHDITFVGIIQTPGLWHSAPAPDPALHQGLPDNLPHHSYWIRFGYHVWLPYSLLLQQGCWLLC